MNKTDFLAFLRREFKKYQQLDEQRSQEKSKKKQYINGLMQASRFFGVSYEELNHIVNEGHASSLDVSDSLPNSEDYLDIPTFLRMRAGE